MKLPFYRSLAESFRLNIYLPEGGLIAPPVATYEADDRLREAMESGRPPQSVFMKADGALEEYMRLIRGRAVPILAFETAEEGRAIAEFAEENNIGDLTLCVPYEKRKLLPEIRRMLPLSRGMLDLRGCEMPEFVRLVAECHRSDATMVLMRGQAERALVRRLQKRFVQVWVENDDLAAAVSSGACGVLTREIGGLYDLIGKFPQNATMRPAPLYAHKSWHVTGETPENSISGCVAAGERGYDAAEIDVKLTGDDVMVVHHDRDTKNLFTKDHVVHETNWKTLKDIRRKAFPEEGLDRMDELMVRMKEYPETPVLIEIKTPEITFGVEETVRQLKELLAREDVQKACTCIMGVIPPYLACVHERLPFLPVAHCTWIREHEKTDSIDENNLRIYRFALETRGANAGYNPYHPMIGKTFTQLAHVRGITVFPWTWAFEEWEDCKAAITESYLEGHDGLTSDWVGKFYDVPAEVCACVPERWTAGKPLAIEGEILLRSGGWLKGGGLEIVSADEGVRLDENGAIVGETGIKRMMLGYRAMLPEGKSIVVFSRSYKVEFEEHAE